MGLEIAYLTLKIGCLLKKLLQFSFEKQDEKWEKIVFFIDIVTIIGVVIEVGRHSSLEKAFFLLFIFCAYL